MRKINYLVLSDLHFGHHRNSTESIIFNLNIFFKKHHGLFKKIKLDIIFIAGDVFDRLLSTSSLDYSCAMRWLSTLLIYCKINKIKLRILEGTPSHDWKQVKIFYDLVSGISPDYDFKYIENVVIEKMEDLGLSVLYVPDEFRPTAAQTLEYVKNELKENGLEKVDIAIMHGGFGHQIPGNLESTHISEEYLNLVRYYINAGHVHTSSVYGRILAQGSFDRLRHGEEEDKGCMLMSIEGEEISFKFLRNDTSMVFKTLKYENKSMDYIISDVRKISKLLPPGSHLRILSDTPANLYHVLHSDKKINKTIILSMGYIKKQVDATPIENYSIGPINPPKYISINKDNVEELVAELLKTFDISKNEENSIMSELSKISQRISK